MSPLGHHHTVTDPASAAFGVALNAISAAREAVAGERLTRAAFAEAPPPEGTRLLAIGKAAPVMAMGALQAAGQRVADCLVIGKDAPDSLAARRLGMGQAVMEGLAASGAATCGSDFLQPAIVMIAARAKT